MKIECSSYVKISINIYFSFKICLNKNLFYTYYVYKEFFNDNYMKISNAFLLKLKLFFNKAVVLSIVGFMKSQHCVDQ